MDRPLSVGVALIAGLFWVHGPILFFFVGPLSVLALYNGSPVITGWVIALIFVCLALGFALAWTWWYLTMPRWRAWAYMRVADTGKLRRWAVAVGLSWSDGCLVVVREPKPDSPRPLPQLDLKGASERDAH
jgi:hypothetical protein